MVAEVIRPLRFLRLVREDRYFAWYVLTYPFKTWRCRLFGHKWGPEKHGYEIGIRTESWRDCQRPGCEGSWETYHYLASGKQRIIG